MACFVDCEDETATIADGSIESATVKVVVDVADDWVAVAEFA